MISPGLSLGFSLLPQVEFRRCSFSVGRTSVSPGVPVDFSSAFCRLLVRSHLYQLPLASPMSLASQFSLVGRSCSVE